MIDRNEPEGPATWQAIKQASEAAGFDMPSEPRTGSMLRFLASTKPGGRLLVLESQSPRVGQVLWNVIAEYL